MTLGEIINSYRTEHRISMDMFAERSGMSKAYVSLLEKNKHPKTGKPIMPSIKVIKQCAEAMHMDFNELFEMIDGEVALASDQEPVRKGVVIPVLCSAAAGIPIEAIEDVIDTEEIPQEMASTGKFFGLKIKGNSMEPDIHDGDIVIVRQQEDAENGETVIVCVNGNTATCKRLRKYKDGIELISNNPSYDPMFYSIKDVSDTPITIIGKVVELRRKL